MSHDARRTELLEQTKQMLHGPLRHARTAALTAALVPLAAVAVSTEINEVCPSGGICGTVFFDADEDGIQDAGEPGIGGASVTIVYVSDGVPYEFTVQTNGDGLYDFGTGVPYGEHTIRVQIPPKTTPTTSDQGIDEAADSDGVADFSGNSVAKVTWLEGETQNSTTDFGFVPSPVLNPGTGTPGYWMNHPEAWPVPTVTVGGVTYTKEQAIALLKHPTNKDKTYTMFSSLVPAMLNVAIGNDPSCVSEAIDLAQAWMAKYGPVGRGVHASSYAWKVGEQQHRQMDNYNNGMLCAPHRE